jgi:alpha-L-fucosidase
MQFNRSLAAALLALAPLAAPPALAQQAPPTATTQAAAPAETPQERDARLAWWREGRFGMFIHWGVYAQAAGYWKNKPVDGIGEWIMNNAKIPHHEYEILAKYFNPVKFDARAWVRSAKQAGMTYIVITSKHHDGFAMFDSKLTTWDIIDSTPFGRDILKELAEACKAEGVRLCFYHSILDWSHPDNTGPNFDRYEEFMKGQLRELLTSYGDIGVLWFDGEWVDTWTDPRGHALEAYIRSLQPKIIVNNRVGKARGGMGGLSKYEAAGDFGTPEQEIPARGTPGVDWETCMTMNDTWGFKSDDHNWKSTRQIIHMLCDIASKGGNFLLNVGPTPEGEIPAPSLERLAAVGKWMNTNAESIRGTTASPFPRKLPWGRVTARSLRGQHQDVTRLYLHVFDWPADGTLRLDGISNDAFASFILGAPDRKLTVARDGSSIVISGLGDAPVDPDCTVIRVDIRGTPAIDAAVLKQGADGVLALAATDASLSGEGLNLESVNGPESVGFWLDEKATVSWEFEAPKGRYSVELNFACEEKSAGTPFTLTCGGSTLKGTTTSTGAWSTFKSVDLGSIELPGGKATLTVAPAGKPKSGLMNLRSLRLKPTK